MLWRGANRRSNISWPAKKSIWLLNSKLWPSRLRWGLGHMGSCHSSFIITLVLIAFIASQASEALPLLVAINLLPHKARFSAIKQYQDCLITLSDRRPAQG
jgi:hypothetical protein